MRQGHLAHAARPGTDGGSDRRAALLAAQLAAVVRGNCDPVGELRPGTFPGGASLAETGGRLWVLVEENAVRRLGPVEALAARRGATEGHLLVVNEAVADGPVLARRAAQFVGPLAVWAVDGVDLAPVTPAPSPEEVGLPAEVEDCRTRLVAAGLEPVVEDGTLIGELLGLETARVVVDPDGGARIEAGVGRFDRDAASMMFADLSERDLLAQAVELVSRYRRPGAPRHPLNQLVPERWLRAAVVTHPGLVGASELAPVASAVPRSSLNEAGVATAVGVAADGRPIVVTCGTATDLDLVASAADDRLARDPDAELVVVVPEGTLAPVTEPVERLRRPARVVTVEDDWRALAADRNRARGGDRDHA